MKFRTPPEWPPSPRGWIPDAGWQPDARWPPAPRGWDFWVNDYDVPIEGPAGLYGGKVERLRWTRIALAGAGALLALLVGAGLGASGSTEQSTAAPLLDLPTHTVTLRPTPAPTVTMTAPPETVTAPPETITLAPATVTLPAQTVTVGSESRSSAGLGIVGGSSSGSDSGSGSSSVYYANCAAARAAGAAPVYRGDPGYRSGLDRDNDGVGCE